jgi:hypothetical protein
VARHTKGNHPGRGTVLRSMPSSQTAARAGLSLGGDPVVTGYEYRDSPDLVYSHIRRFIADVSTPRTPQ